MLKDYPVQYEGEEPEKKGYVYIPAEKHVCSIIT
jgi:hypothetical protein